MKISCLINSHNYRKFIGEAVASCLDQVRPFDEIIIVDDGSTDGTVGYLQQEFGQHEPVRIIAKEQGGQLSCFNRGVPMAAGDLVFFLDADDKYQPEYTATALELYQNRPDIDFLSVNYDILGKPYRKRRRYATREKGISVVSTILYRTWVGMPTSCLSMRMSLAKKVLPFPFEPLWQSRADDVVIFGSSLVGACKYHLAKPLVDYRVHGNNHFAGRKQTPVDKMRHGLRVNQLIHWFVQREGYDLNSLSYLLHREFRTWQRPKLREMLYFLRLSASARMPIGKRIEQMAAIVAHMVSEHMQKSRRQCSPAILESVKDEVSAKVA